MVLAGFNLDPKKGALAHMLTVRGGDGRRSKMRVAGASSLSSSSSGCLRNCWMRRGTPGLPASFGFAEELAHRGGIGRGGMVRRDVSARMLDYRIGGMIVFDQSTRGGSQRTSIVVRYRNAGILYSKGGCGALHRHDREIS